MKSDWRLTEEDLDRFLRWLDPDREKAAHKYQKIRDKLITILNAHCCPVSEDLVDQAFDQTMKRLPHMIDTFQGEPTNYIYVVAKNLAAKYFKERSKIAELPDPDLLPDRPRGTDVEAERAFECIERCLSQLPPELRRLFENYYREIKNAGKYRRQLAKELSMTVETLRLKAFRIKEKIRVCAEECLKSDQKFDQSSEMKLG